MFLRREAEIYWRGVSYAGADPRCSGPVRHFCVSFVNSDGYIQSGRNIKCIEKENKIERGEGYFCVILNPGGFIFRCMIEIERDLKKREKVTNFRVNIKTEMVVCFL